MTVRTYKIITNICFASGAGAILLLGRFGSFQWPLVLISVAAGAVALSLHLYSQWHPLKQEEVPAQSASVPQLPIQQLPEAQEEAAEEEEPEPSACFTTGVRYYLQTQLVKPLDLSEYFDEVSFGMKRLLTPHRFDVDNVIEIAQKLAPPRTDFEVMLTAEGNVVIRPIRGAFELLEQAQERELEFRDPAIEDYIN